MARVVFAARAARDLDEIVSFIAQTDASVASRVLGGIEEACTRLALSYSPELGQ